MDYLILLYHNLGLLVLVLALPANATQNNSLTWFEAATVCKVLGQQLYSSADKSLVAEFINVSNEKYWIGAKVMYSPWRWTDDQTTLFTYVGYRRFTEKETNSFKPLRNFKFWNEAVRCYSHIYPKCNTTYIGLQGTKCFCLGSGNTSMENVEENRCWGNSDEYCGTTHGMSVYKAELQHTDLQWDLSNKGLCGYVQYTNSYLRLGSETNCQKKKKKMYVCKTNNNGNHEDVIYLGNNRSDWLTANSSCSLTSIDANNFEVVYNLTKPDVQYWIGLHRYRYIGWIDRDDDIDIPNSGVNGCVWVKRLENGSLVFGVQTCNSSAKFVCVNQTVTSKMPYSYSANAQNTSRHPDNTTDYITESQSDGVAIGVSLAVVFIIILVLLVLAVIWMKRKKRYCFREKSCVRVISHVPSTGNAYELSDEPRVQSDYCDVNYSSPQPAIGSSNTHNASNDYEFEQEVPRRVQPKIKTEGQRHKDKPGAYDKLYANSKTQGQQLYNSDVYTNVDSQDIVGASSETYDRATFSKEVPSQDSTYNHIHTHNNLEGSSETYDTATFSKEVPSHDSTYNHIHCHDDVDESYDRATFSKRLPACDSTYNHVVSEDDTGNIYAN